MHKTSFLGPSRPAMLVGFVLASFAILFLPYAFAPGQVSTSESYLFGFNNRVATILLVVSAAAGAVWAAELAPYRPAREAGRPVPLVTLLICLCVAAAACGAMYQFAGGFGGFAESGYEIDRVWLLLQGQTPYEDFEWPFGALLLYGPAFLCRTLALSPTQSCALFWVVSSLVGIVLLYATINLIDRPTDRRQSIFLLFSLGALLVLPLMATHYSLIRYVTPLWFILWVWRVDRAGHRIAAAGLAVAASAVLLTISPEITIAFGFASVVSLFPRPMCQNSLAAYGLLLLGLALLLWQAYRLRLFTTLLASGGGAESFPLPLSAPILFFFGVVFVGAWLLLAGFRSTSPDNCVPILLFAIPMLAAALGRCDPLHLMLNGLGFFLAVAFHASTRSSAWTLFCGGFITCIVATMVFGGVWFWRPHIDIAEAGSASPPPATLDLASLYRVPAGTKFAAPFKYRPNQLGSYLSPDIDLGYYGGLENASSEAATRRKIQDLQNEPERYLLVPANFPNLCKRNVQGARKLMKMIFVAPYTIKPSHVESVHRPLCDYIASHYTPFTSASREIYWYEVLRPN